MVRAGIVGGTGKLGKDILAQLLDRKDLAVGAVVARRESPFVGSDAASLVGRLPAGIPVCAGVEEAADRCDIYIDCTNAEAFRTNVRAYQAAGKPVIVATTGFGTDEQEGLGILSRQVPVVICPNFSLGVYKFLKLVRFAAELFDSDMDVDILEYHHKQKKDIPSGTARRMAELIGEVHGKPGTEGRIAVHSIRAGNLIGEHSVSFINGENERIELSHHIFSRESFAKGVIRTVEWIMDQKAGLYGMEDIFGEGEN